MTKELEFKKIGLFVNPARPSTADCSIKIRHWLELNRVSYEYFNDYPLFSDWPDKGCRYSHLDLAIVLGGDGTFLNVARAMALSDVPLFGINVGRLGFLTEIDFRDVEERLSDVLAKRFQLQKRYFLKVTVYERETRKSFIAINDAVISRARHARLIKIEIRLQDQVVESYRGDGVIFSSATGSTGYSLSAGGPVAYPEMRTIIVTPIAPHSLSCRPIVMPPGAVLSARAEEAQDDVLLTIDGVSGIQLGPESCVEILSPSTFINVLTFKEINFFSVLRKKLGN
ncbi:MAG: NAD(+)/NADH kinase [Candidatus Wallbacteria bacterium]|nr:NAD(+)/NADH kinase [Candidatus Wallbacteria bacterium]